MIITFFRITFITRTPKATLKKAGDFTV